MAVEIDLRRETCLACPLPECDDAHLDCLWRRLTRALTEIEEDRKRRVEVATWAVMGQTNRGAIEAQ